MNNKDLDFMKTTNEKLNAIYALYVSDKTKHKDALLIALTFFAPSALSEIGGESLNVYKDAFVNSFDFMKEVAKFKEGKNSFSTYMAARIRQRFINYTKAHTSLGAYMAYFGKDDKANTAETGTCNGVSFSIEQAEEENTILNNEVSLKEDLVGFYEKPKHLQMKKLIDDIVIEISTTKLISEKKREHMLYLLSNFENRESVIYDLKTSYKGYSLMLRDIGDLLERINPDYKNRFIHIII